MVSSILHQLLGNRGHQHPAPAASQGGTPASQLLGNCGKQHPAPTTRQCGRNQHSTNIIAGHLLLTLLGSHRLYPYRDNVERAQIQIAPTSHKFYREPRMSLFCHFLVLQYARLNQTQEESKYKLQGGQTIKINVGKE